MSNPAVPQGVGQLPSAGVTGPAASIANFANEYENKLRDNLARRGIANEQLDLQSCLTLETARQLNSIRTLLWVALIIAPSLGFLFMILSFVII